ncbi:DUF397 domain-containing protein [Streptomyces turgidiscabies]|uniref:DUF397 domain-containing protein n=1 Tax=Streptomyces turgidiscabies TaxID=85558 RepID=A0ABU0RHK0_9ACTN|nr:DUF397 domain-containing protein [Streptomyces turgidiscabies]MDQ0931463.1 hypothetical protein [Streptomyces turgidiscabies]
MADKPVVRATDLPGVAWIKSSYSGSDQSQCVEIAHVKPTLGRVAVRDSKNSEGPALLITPSAFAQFTRNAAQGRYGA